MDHRQPSANPARMSSGCWFIFQYHRADGRIDQTFTDFFPRATPILHQSTPSIGGIQFFFSKKKKIIISGECVRRYVTWRASLKKRKNIQISCCQSNIDYGFVNEVSHSLRSNGAPTTGIRAVERDDGSSKKITLIDW